jgi:hypothetical protein
MRTQSRQRRLARSIAAFVVVCAAGLTVTPAIAAERDLDATANGRAAAAAVFVPFRVNPNFELYPAFSFSEIANSASQSGSHGISAGFYPGFLLDAFMDFYGFKGPGRALLGVAETQWPDSPQVADASTGDFAALCKESGNNPQITQYFPKQLFDGCQQFYNAFTGAFGGSLPVRLSAGHSESGHLESSGYADGFQMTLPAIEGLRIGHARSTSATTAASAHASASDATSLLHDVTFGALYIAEIRSTASATDDETLGPKSARSFEVVGATLAGRPVTIDENGIRPVTGNPAVESMIAQFAAQGFDVKLVQGHESIDPDSGEVRTASGGLQLRMIRSGTPAELQEPSDRLCAETTELQKNPLLTPGSIYTADYDLALLPLVNDAYQRVWDENYPLGLLLPRELEGEEPLPPVIPCASVLFDRAVDAGIVLGVTEAAARFVPGVPLPDLGDVLTPGTPDRTIVTTIALPGGVPDVIVPGGGSPMRPGALAAAGPEFGADVAQRIKLVYGVMVLMLVALVAGRSAFRRLVQT